MTISMLEDVAKTATASQFIRLSALNAGEAQAPRKKIVYSDLEYETVTDEACWLCGGKTDGMGWAKSKAIKPTFTDHDISKNRASQSVCRGCVFCLNNKNRPLRNYSILATTLGFYHPTREQMRGMLLYPPQPPFVMIMAVSGQKHLTFKAEVAWSRNNYPVLLEEMKANIDTEMLKSILLLYERLYSNGFSKTEIREGRYKQHRILEFGIDKWERLEEEIKPYREGHSQLFLVADFVAQQQEGMTEDGADRPKIVLVGEEKKMVVEEEGKKDDKEQLALF